MGEGGDRIARPCLEGGQHVGVPHNGVDAGFAVRAEGQKSLHGHIAESPGRLIGDAQQVHIVVRIYEALEVGEDVFDFAAIEETLAADQPVSDPRLAQSRLDGARLDIRAEQDGLLAPIDLLGESIVLDVLRHGPAFSLVGVEGVEGDFAAFTFCRPQALFTSPRVLSDDGVSGAEDDVGGAVILLQLDDLDLGVMLFEV